MTRGPVLKPGIERFMIELAETAPRRRRFRVLITGGGTAVMLGWRTSTIDIDIAVSEDAVLREIQKIKIKLGINVELAKPTDFVPPLSGEENRHIFIATHGTVDFFHFDPYGQFLSKALRAHGRDIEDIRHMLNDGLVESQRMRELVAGIPDEAFSRYPNISRGAVETALDEVFSTESFR